MPIDINCEIHTDRNGKKWACLHAEMKKKKYDWKKEIVLRFSLLLLSDECTANVMSERNVSNWFSLVDLFMYRFFIRFVKQQNHDSVTRAKQKKKNLRRYADAHTRTLWGFDLSLFWNSMNFIVRLQDIWMYAFHAVVDRSPQIAKPNRTKPIDNRTCSHTYRFDSYTIG